MTTISADRPALLRRRLRLEYSTVGWNLIIPVFLLREPREAWEGEERD